MAAYLGDFIEDDAVHFLWSTNNASGASITRATNGTVQVYKDNADTQSTVGVTDTEDFDSLTGIHACTIDLSADAFYATGANYTVVLAGATIDGQTVNAVLAHFSIQNRYHQPSGTLSVTVTTNNDKTGYRLSATGVDDILDEAVVEPTQIWAWPSTLRNIIGWLGAVSRNKLTQTETTQTIRNDADDDDIATATVSDDGTTFVRDEFISGA